MLKGIILFGVIALPTLASAHSSRYGHSHGGYYGGHHRYYPAFKCKAENGRGFVFKGKAYSYRAAQSKALNKCERNSYRPFSCRIIRCRRI